MSNHTTDHASPAGGKPADFRVVKAGFRAVDWVEAMQNTRHKIKISLVKVKGAGAEPKGIPLIHRDLDSFSFEVDGDQAFIKIDGERLEIVSASKAAGSTLLFTPNGLNLLVPVKVDVMQYSLSQSFKNSSAFVGVPTLFSAMSLVEAYQLEEFKKSLTGVLIRNSHQRFISLSGLSANDFDFRLQMEQDGKKVTGQKIFLKLRGEEFDVEALSHQNGMTVLVHPDRLESYVPSAAYEFMQANFVPLNKRDKTELMRGVIAGDVESFVEYMHRNRDRLLGRIRGHVKKDEAAEDVLQDVQLHFLEKMKSPDWFFNEKPNDMVNYIERAVTNRGLDAHRRSKAWGDVFAEDIVVSAQDGEALSITDQTADPESDPLIQVAASEFLRRYLEGLNDFILANPKGGVKRATEYMAECFVDEGRGLMEYSSERGVNARTLQTEIKRTRDDLIAAGLGPEAIRSGKIPAFEVTPS